MSDFPCVVIAVDVQAKGVRVTASGTGCTGAEVLDAAVRTAQACMGRHPAGFGLAGEAGPEAILPLTRKPDGSVGVRARGNLQ